MRSARMGPRHRRPTGGEGGQGRRRRGAQGSGGAWGRRRRALIDAPPPPLQSLDPRVQKDLGDCPDIPARGCVVLILPTFPPSVTFKLFFNEKITGALMRLNEIYLIYKYI